MKKNAKRKTQNAKPQFKIKNFKFWVVVLPFTFLLLPLFCFAQPVSSSDLIEHAQGYDGQTIAYTGEVIGDIMKRGDHAWINVSDGKNAIGIWAGLPLIKDIVYAGNYRSTGDLIEVTGTFHRACPEHGGDLDLHASRIGKIAVGGYNPEALNINIGKRNTVIVLLGVIGLIWILTQLKFK